MSYRTASITYVIVFLTASIAAEVLIAAAFLIKEPEVIVVKTPPTDGSVGWDVRSIWVHPGPLTNVSLIVWICSFLLLLGKGLISNRAVPGWLAITCLAASVLSLRFLSLELQYTLPVEQTSFWIRVTGGALLCLRHIFQRPTAPAVLPAPSTS